MGPGVDGVYAVVVQASDSGAATRTASSVNTEGIKRLRFAAEPAEILFGICGGIKNGKRIVPEGLWKEEHTAHVGNEVDGGEGELGVANGGVYGLPG